MNNEDIQKAIKHFAYVRDGAVAVLDGGFGETPNESNIVYKNRKLYAELAIAALEKQVPKKPVIKRGELHKTHKLGRLLLFYCPMCEKYIGAIDETDPQRGGGFHEDLNGCSSCLQAIDFTGYKKDDSLDEIEWER